MTEKINFYNKEKEEANPGFLARGGEMGERTRAFD